MTGESEVNNAPTEGNETQASEDVATQQTSNAATSEDVAALKEQLEKQSALIEKLRQHEQTSLEREKKERQKREGVEGELDTLKEQLTKQMEDVVVDLTLEKELTAAKARNIDLTKKLVNTSDIPVVNGRADTSKIREAINQLKESEGYLFLEETSSTNDTQKPNATTPARAGEGPQEDVVKKAMKNAKSVQELKEVMKKYSVGVKR